MQSWAHDDSCYYIWDCIVCSDDKPVERRDSECISQRKRERKKIHEFASPSGFFGVCVCDGRVCFVSLWPDMHIKSVFAFGKLESSTFSVSHV